MRKLLVSAATSLALAATAIGAAAPADAQRWHGGYGHRGGYYHGGYGGGGAAVAAGIIGLGVGAAIASDHYRGGYYGYGPGYYGYAPPPPPYAYGYGYCRSDWRWDGYRDRYVRVRYCD